MFREPNVSLPFPQLTGSSSRAHVQPEEILPRRQETCSACIPPQESLTSHGNRWFADKARLRAVQVAVSIFEDRSAWSTRNEFWETIHCRPLDYGLPSNDNASHGPNCRWKRGTWVQTFCWFREIHRNGFHIFMYSLCGYVYLRL